MPENTAGKRRANPNRPAAVLEHLSGPDLGERSYIWGDVVDFRVDEDRHLTLSSPGAGDTADLRPGPIARFVRQNGTYRLEAAGGNPVWVNGRQIDSGELVNRDIIEFGEKGPLSRFRLPGGSGHARRYFSDICSDCWDYLHTSRRPLPGRMLGALADGVRGLVTDTTVLFRVGVLVMLTLLGLATFQQYRINELQHRRLTSGEMQLEGFAQDLARAQDHAITPSDLDELQQVFVQSLSANLGRLEALEQQSKASEQVIGATANSVVFLQGAYGYRDSASGRPLRHVLGATGRPLATQEGRPVLSLDGDGPVAERQFTGTGFAVGDGTLLATNRHVAVPWTTGGAPSGLSEGELEAFMIRFIAYSPAWTEPVEVHIAGTNDDADLALVRMTDPARALPPLTISQKPIMRGQPIIVMGFPTGLRSMIARAGKDIVDRLQETENPDFWYIAELLASAGLIQPLSSAGIVAQITPEFIVYDAATTRGGSGGPVLNTQGEVVAVNSAILAGYDGSNFGIPVDRLRDLMDSIDTPASTN